MKIRWIGPFNTSGFGTENIHMVKAMLALGHEVHAIPYPQGAVIVDGTRGIERCFVDKPETWPDRTVVHAIPPPLSRKIDVLWQNYEYTPAPDSWRWMLDNATVVTAETPHSKACLQSITTREVGIVPSGIDLHFGEGFKGSRIVGTDEFAFLSVLEWVPRKQGKLLIEAFCEAFTPADKVYLFLKARRGTGNPRAEIPRIVAAYPAMRDHVVYVDQEFDDMGMVYPAFDGYVLPSALEGWGITFMEAIACGLKPICPSAGGNTYFCDSENSYPVSMGPWEPATLFGDATIFSPDAKWRVPDKEDLKAKMRLAYTKKERLSPEYTAAFRARWSWENAAKKLLEAMQ